MNYKEHTEIILSLTDKVDKMWDFFFIANVSIVVWFMSKKYNLELHYTIFASLIYSSHIVINCLKHLRAYRFLNLSIDDLQLSIDDYDIKSEDLIEGIKTIKYNNRYTMVIAMYFLVLIFVNSILWMEYINR